MDNMNEEKAVRGYEERAREAGYCVKSSVVNGAWRYVTPLQCVSTTLYKTQGEAYKAACLDNDLIEEGH